MDSHFHSGPRILNNKTTIFNYTFSFNINLHILVGFISPPEIVLHFKMYDFFSSKTDSLKKCVAGDCIHEEFYTGFGILVF